MATVASGSKLFYADNNLVIAKGKREHALYDGVNLPTEISVRKGETRSQLEGIMIESCVPRRNHKRCNAGSVRQSSQKRKFYPVKNAISPKEKHLKFLDSYLEKLQGDTDTEQPSMEMLQQRAEPTRKKDQQKVDSSLQSLENYFGKVRSDLQASINTSVKKDVLRRRDRSLKNNYMELRLEDTEGKQKSEDEVSDFYIIGILASINIAVFLFEMATPVKNSNLELFSLPMVYGAKINTLILVGEWWRLVTPMFLHSGIFHISLGSWVLFTLGLQVSQEYGSFTFLLIYLLGGISGNLTSYLHTPEPTVGGTGPVFAIIGAWMIYQIQNKDVISRNASERMFRNAIITTALSLILSSFSPIDDWAHFAATFTGVTYGFFACPTLQVKDISSEAGRQKRVTLVKRYADPCKSLAFFSLFLLLLSSFLFMVEPPIDLTG